MILSHSFMGCRITKSVSRFDIVKSSGYYKPFENLLLNKKGPNMGGLSFHCSSRPIDWKGEPYGLAITKSKKKNITSIKRPDRNLSLGYGDIHGTNDACLIKLKTSDLVEGFMEIEIFIAKGMKNEARAVYDLYIGGELEDEIKLLDGKARTRFDVLDYWTPVWIGNVRHH